MICSRRYLGVVVVGLFILDAAYLIANDRVASSSDRKVDNSTPERMLERNRKDYLQLTSAEVSLLQC